ncbi:helix-turn-helix domain-containing protein [Streptomyces avicenniae]|uniref:helix-turn-helix domain-containing protein n=1 Tax=Streptomyces avicenniae TaxID=500153 RepID=UPI00069B3AFD|nr:helix-turn-helix domain-containing protein [Streptomyces avicenniae]
MHVHLSARTRHFTVLGNDVLRDNRLSFTARGILCYLLSLPDGAREDVRTLADKHPNVGRRGVAKALDELVALGYYVRRSVRCARTGHVRTETHVFDVPQTGPPPTPPPAPPPPPPPGTGEPPGGGAGASPEGVKNPGEEPSLPGARWLVRLTATEPRLTLGAAEAAALAPLAEPWLARGVPEPEARSLLTAGLPSVVHSARALLANRLTRKLPAQRAASPPPPTAPPPPLRECARCRDPLPRARRQALCAGCDGTAPPPPEPALAHEAVTAHVTRLRELLRGAPATPSLAL